MTDVDPAGGTAAVTDVLIHIWGELLGLKPDDIPLDTTFLRLGGDSVLAVRMAALVRKRLGVVLALSDVVVEITVTELTGLVTRRADEGTTTRAMPVELLRRTNREAAFPLLPLQQGYFVGQHDGWELSYASAHFYGDVALSDVDGDEAADALEDALQRLAEHQPGLRTRVTPDGRQYVLPLNDPQAVPPLRVYDLRDAAPDEVAITLALVREEMSTTGPDPRHGPGFDFRLSLLPGDRGRLHTGMSLLVLDGWSATVLNRELLTLASDWNAVLAPLDVDFGDYVESISQLRRTEAWAADRAWWWDRLDGAPYPPALPLCIDPRDVRPSLMATREARLSPGRWAALRDRCAKHDVTASAALLTAFSVVLAGWAGHRRMLMNSLQLNRLPLHPDVHRIVGAFASTMLLPVELVPGRSFAELATTMQRTFTEHAAHNLISGVEVSRELARRRGTRRPIGPVVFQSTLGMDAAIGEQHPEAAGPLGEIGFDDYYHQLRTPQVALEVRLFELREEMVVVFSLVEELFHEGEVAATFDELVRLIEALADGPGWDHLVELPVERDPAADGLRLGQLDEPGVAAEAGPLRDEVEEGVAEVWEELLEVPILDRGADFFALGGDSLLAIRALARMAARTGVRVGVREFWEAPTVAGVAAAARTVTG